MNGSLNLFFMRLSFLFIVVITLILLYFLWLAYKPVNVYYDVNQPYEILNENKVVNAGDTVVVRQTYCKSTDSNSRLIIILENGYYETIRIIESAVSAGCYDNESRSATIPANTAEGEYRIRYRIIVDVNPFRDETYEFVTERFTVINSELDLE